MSNIDVIYRDYSSCCSAFKDGLGALRQREVSMAESFFRHASDSVAVHDRHYCLYQSYLGLAKVLNGDPGGLDICYSVTVVMPQPDLFLNLARAASFLRQRAMAVVAIEEGLMIDEAHPGLLALQDSIGWRRKRPVRFLPRDHRLNQMIGVRLRK